MTRFARAKRESVHQEHNASSWAKLNEGGVKQEKPSVLNAEHEKHKKKRKNKLVNEVPELESAVTHEKKRKNAVSVVKNQVESSTGTVGKKKKNKIEKSHVIETATDQIETEQVLTVKKKRKRKLAKEIVETKKKKLLREGKVKKLAETSPDNSPQPKKKRKKKNLKVENLAETTAENAAEPKKKRKKLKVENLAETTAENAEAKKKRKLQEPPQANDHSNTGTKFAISDKEIYQQRTFNDIKTLAQNYVKEGKLLKSDVNKILLKWKTRETRRMNRMQEREDTRECFNCRKPGHLVANCPEQSNNPEYGMGICFKCGSTEHNIYSCKAKVKGFPYANCFVCGKQGHLSRQCPDNPNGAYPHGGDCKLCGERDHLKKDCPLLKTAGMKEEVTVEASKFDAYNSADVDEALIKFESTPKAKKPKMVKM